MLVYVKQTCPKPGPFCLQGCYLNTFSRGPIDKSMYLITKVSDKKFFFYFSPIWVYVKHVTAGAGPFLTAAKSAGQSYKPNIKRLGLLDSDKKILRFLLIFFFFVAMATSPLHGINFLEQL